MIDIISKSREFDKIETYLMTTSPDITSVKDLDDGEKLTVTGYLFFNDVKPNGETAEIMSIITDEKKVYSCQSATFKRSLQDIANLFDGEPFTIIKISGETKAGREYVNCVLDTESV